MVFIFITYLKGSCCIDEIASQHINSDFIIHYGNSCLSKVKKGCSSLLIFGQVENFEMKTEVFKKEYKKDEKIIILYDLLFLRKAFELFNKLKEEEEYNNIVIGFVDENIKYQNIKIIEKVEKNDDELEEIDIKGLKIKLLSNSKFDEYKIFYLGFDNFHFTQILLEFNNFDVIFI
jgi:diphthamide biosynthesis protein 2